jgi:hypothetical protein
MSDLENKKRTVRDIKQERKKRQQTSLPNTIEKASKDSRKDKRLRKRREKRRLKRIESIKVPFKRLDENIIHIAKEDICLFVAIRNNEKLIPHFLKHYRRIGVNHFFFIDNMSTDRSIDILLEEENVYIFQTDEPYRKSKRGANWNRWCNRLQKYTHGNWCIATDSDEFLVYPDYEEKDIHSVIEKLEAEKSTAVYATLIDMYSKCPIKDVDAKDIYSKCCYFDYPLRPKSNPRLRLLRSIGINRRISLNKVSIFKSSKRSFIQSGHHTIKGCKSSSLMQLGMLHYKFDSGYLEHLRIESKRGMYYNQSFYKKKLYQALLKNPNFSFYKEGISHKYTGSKSLEDLGIIFLK